MGGCGAAQACILIGCSSGSGWQAALNESPGEASRQLFVSTNEDWSRRPDHMLGMFDRLLFFYLSRGLATRWAYPPLIMSNDWSQWNGGGLRLSCCIPGHYVFTRVSTATINANKQVCCFESSKRLSKTDRGYMFNKDLCCGSWKAAIVSAIAAILSVG